MNILVVGGAGYVGGAVTDELMKTNHNFKVYDNLCYEESYRKEVPFVFGKMYSKKNIPIAQIRI